MSLLGQQQTIVDVHTNFMTRIGSRLTYINSNDLNRCWDYYVKTVEQTFGKQMMQTSNEDTFWKVSFVLFPIEILFVSVFSFISR